MNCRLRLIDIDASDGADGCHGANAADGADGTAMARTLVRVLMLAMVLTPAMVLTLAMALMLATVLTPTMALVLAIVLMLPTVRAVGGCQWWSNTDMASKVIFFE